jgi:2-polyprenyl-6-hydroxyphenyl methylase / 3-demethylubiquinone-9 3-methyltransferase
MAEPVRPRNDPAQYEDLAEEWSDPAGRFAALHWLARVRAELVPPPGRVPGATGRAPLLVDVGCGGGLLAHHVTGYRHVGVDLVAAGLHRARELGVRAVQGDALALPLRSGVADVVVAGEIFEHVRDLDGAVAEVARVVRPGGTVVFDTINATRFARLSLVTVAERLPGGPPPRIHDPSLFVPPERLHDLFRRHGVAIACRGLRPSALDYLRFLAGRGTSVRMLPVRSLAGVYQGVGRRARAAGAGEPSA